MTPENNAEVVAALRLKAAGHGDKALLALGLGVSRQALSMTLSGKRSPTPAMAATVGYRKVIRWEKVDD